MGAVMSMSTRWMDGPVPLGRLDLDEFGLHLGPKF